MSNLKHIDKYNTVRSFYNYCDSTAPSCYNTIEKAEIDELITNGIDSSSYESLSDAFSTLNECLMGHSHFGGEWPNAAIREIEELMFNQLYDRRNGYSYDSSGVDWFYTHERSENIGICPEVPSDFKDYDAWIVNIEEQTAILPVSDGSQYLIELTQKELEYILSNDEDSFMIGEITNRLSPEGDIPYFYSDDEMEMLISDLNLMISQINDILRKYDDKYLLRFKSK